MVRRLLLIRHADYLRVRGHPMGISEEGKTQTKAITPLIKTLVRKLSEEDIFCSLTSSHKRRAIDTALLISDELGSDLNTDPNLELTHKSFYEKFYSKISGSMYGLSISVGHKEIVNDFPTFLKEQLGELNGLGFSPRGFCKGYYYDLEAKTYQLFPEDFK